MKSVQWIQFQELGDERGSLVAIEIGNQKEIPFDVKRVYYIYRTEEGVSRGFHAHKRIEAGSLRNLRKLPDGVRRRH